MMLSSYFNNDQVIHDCYFETLGLSNSKSGMKFLSFCDTSAYVDEIYNNKEIVGVICKREFMKCFVDKGLGVALSDDPRKDFFLLHNILANDFVYNNKSTDNKIGHGCKISKKASLDTNGIVIGNNVVIEDYVRIKGPCNIGDNCIIHSGTSIGGDGYEFKRYKSDVLDVVHCGSVNIESNVIIWENSTIHKAVYPWDRTSIGKMSRIGAQSHIDHGAKIGECVEVCARCVISGRADIGNYAFLGPGTIISNRIVIGENSRVLLGSVVTKNIEKNKTVSGNFAISHDKHMYIVKENANIKLL